MKYHFKIVAIIFLIASAVGFFDATYLTIEHYRNSIPPCAIAGCEIVLISEYNVIAGIPVALLGSLYYLTMLILSIAYLDNKKEIFLLIASYGSAFGLIASLYFVYLQFFVIGQICQYCMISAMTSTILFLCGVYVIVKRKNMVNLGPVVDKKLTAEDSVV